MTGTLKRLQRHIENIAYLRKWLSSGEFIGAGMTVTLKIGKNGEDTVMEITDPAVIKTIIANTIDGGCISVRGSSIALSSFCKEAKNTLEKVLIEEYV